MFTATAKNYDDERGLEIARRFLEAKIPNSKLEILGEEKKITFLSENIPSMELIEAMFNCEKTVLNFGDETNNPVIDDETAKPNSNENNIIDAKPDSKSSAKKKKAKTSSESVKTEKGKKKQTPKKTADTPKKPVKKVNEGGRRHYKKSSEYCSKEYFEIDKIPELKKFIQNANNDTQLINSLSKWLSLKQKAEERWPIILENTFKEASLNWSKLAKDFGCTESSLQSAYDRKVKVEMEPYGISISAQKFILTVVNYYKRIHNVKTVETKTEDSSENFDSDEADKESLEETLEKGKELSEDSSKTDVSEKTEEISETASEKPIPYEKPIPKMKCMAGIEHFEEALRQMDETLKKEKKVRYILNVMGLQLKDEREKSIILEMCDFVVNNNFASGLVSGLLSKKFYPEQRMIFSTFVYDYIRQHDPNRKIKTSDFLNDLNKVVRS